MLYYYNYIIYIYNFSQFQIKYNKISIIGTNKETSIRIFGLSDK